MFWLVHHLFFADIVKCARLCIPKQARLGDQISWVRSIVWVAPSLDSQNSFWSRSALMQSIHVIPIHILIPTAIHLLFSFRSHQWRSSYIYKLVSSALLSQFRLLLSFGPITTSANMRKSSSTANSHHGYNGRQGRARRREECSGSVERRSHSDQVFEGAEAQPKATNSENTISFSSSN